jgi:hypothetical protein
MLPQHNLLIMESDLVRKIVCDFDIVLCGI